MVCLTSIIPYSGVISIMAYRKSLLIIHCAHGLSWPSVLGSSFRSISSQFKSTLAEEAVGCYQRDMSIDLSYAMTMRAILITSLHPNRFPQRAH